MELGCLYKRKVASSGPSDYVGRSGRGLTTSLNIRSRRMSKNKQKARNTNICVAIQTFVEILEEFKDVYYTGYSRKKAKNQPTKSYYFLVKQISKLLKSNKQVLIRTKREKSEVVRTKNVSKTIDLQSPKDKVYYVPLDPVADYIYISDLNIRLPVGWKLLPNLNIKLKFQTKISNSKLNFQNSNLPCPPG